MEQIKPKTPEPSSMPLDKFVIVVLAIVAAFILAGTGINRLGDALQARAGMAAAPTALGQTISVPPGAVVTIYPDRTVIAYPPTKE